MAIRPHRLDLFHTELPARMPFRYGMASMSRLTHVLLKITAEIDGETSTGFAAENLCPKWFKKDPAQSLEEESAELKEVVGQAARFAAGLDAASPFAFQRKLAARQSQWGNESGLPPLLTGLGTSLVERAVIDAFCRRHRTTFARALRANAFGIDLGAVHASLGGTAPADWLPAEPLAKVILRHTVGLGDPLTAGEIPAGERLDDGLPQALDDIIVAGGIRHFKIKVAGSPAEALDRLRAIARVLQDHAPAEYAFTLDGNESFANGSDLAALGEGLATDPDLVSFARHLLFIEQPFPRDLALTEAAGEAIHGLPRPWPVIIDESDATPESLPEALRLGYAGTSHKNCKGVFKGIANACLLAQRRRQNPDAPTILSGEDLTTVPPFALQQDLAVQAALGNASLERNGHHYFAGLAGWPAEIRRETAAAHPDLFRPLGTDNATLAIAAGEIATGSCNAAPFGTVAAPDLAALFPRLGPPMEAS